MMTTNNEVVVITGATSGIGLELTHLMAKSAPLCLIGRSKEKLEKLTLLLSEKYPGPFYYIVKDLSKENAAYEVFTTFKEKGLTPSILYNNAGIGDYEYFLDSDITKQQSIINVNIKALMELCYYFGNEMKKKQKGVIVNVASIGAYTPGPLMATYYASKAFVLSFSLAISEEFKKENVIVKVVSPGPTNTAFFEKANSNCDMMAHIKPSDPSLVAKAIFDFTFKKGTTLVVGFKNKLGVLGLRFITLKKASKIVMNIQKKRI